MHENKMASNHIEELDCNENNNYSEEDETVFQKKKSTQQLKSYNKKNSKTNEVVYTNKFPLSPVINTLNKNIDKSITYKNRLLKLNPK